MLSKIALIPSFKQIEHFGPVSLSDIFFNITFNNFAKWTVVSSCCENSIGLLMLRAFRVLLLYKTVDMAIILSIV